MGPFCVARVLDVSILQLNRCRRDSVFSFPLLFHIYVHEFKIIRDPTVYLTLNQSFLLPGCPSQTHAHLDTHRLRALTSLEQVMIKLHPALFEAHHDTRSSKLEHSQFLALTNLAIRGVEIFMELAEVFNNASCIYKAGRVVFDSANLTSTNSHEQRHTKLL